MTSSVDEISRQVQEANQIAGSAVSQDRRTRGRTVSRSKLHRRGYQADQDGGRANQSSSPQCDDRGSPARAKAGRGFAKALAAQTAKATDEIGLHIAGIQAATQDAVATIKEIGITIGWISEIASTVAVAVEAQGAGTQEIVRSVQDAVRGTAEVAANVTEVDRNVGKSTSASSQVLASTQAIAKESTILKVPS